jgi:membrane-associated protein
MLANIITDVTDWLDDISSRWWYLIVILVIALLDSVLPIVPSETAVIIGGIAAGQGDQSLALVIAAGAIGAFLGDNTAYVIGRRFSGFWDRRAERNEKTRRRMEWARAQIRKRGGLLLITARFVPGGRTVLTLTSGITHQPRGWFAGWVAVAAVLWASYAAILGAVFGASFKDNHTLAFFLAFGTALSITAIIEIVRHQRAKGAAREPAPLP